MFDFEDVFNRPRGSQERHDDADGIGGSFGLVLGCARKPSGAIAPARPGAPNSFAPVAAGGARVAPRPARRILRRELRELSPLGRYDAESRRILRPAARPVAAFWPASTASRSARSR